MLTKTRLVNVVKIPQTILWILIYNILKQIFKKYLSRFLWLVVYFNFKR